KPPVQERRWRRDPEEGVEPSRRGAHGFAAATAAAWADGSRGGETMRRSLWNACCSVGVESPCPLQGRKSAQQKQLRGLDRFGCIEAPAVGSMLLRLFRLAFAILPVHPLNFNAGPLEVVTNHSSNLLGDFRRPPLLAKQRPIGKPLFKFREIRDSF